MPNNQKPNSRLTSFTAPPLLASLKITSTYAVFGTLWILLSDKLLYMLSISEAQFYQISVYKGWFYILITAALLFVLIYKRIKSDVALNIELSHQNASLRETKEALNKNYDQLHLKEQLLRISDERYQLVLEGVSDGIWDFDLKSQTFYVSKKFFSILGIEDNLSEIITFDEFESLLHPNEKSIVSNRLSAYLNNEIQTYSEQFRMRTASGEYIWVLNSGIAKRNEQGEPIKMVGALKDITKAKQSQDRIKQLAYFDPLTGLPNRARLEEVVTGLLEQNHRLGFIYIDIDDFKVINDLVGHAQGDVLLKQLALSFLNLKLHYHILSRISGDEFVFVIADHESVDQLSELAEMILLLVRQPWTLLNRSFHLSCSIGIAYSPEHGISYNHLFKAADTAMYNSKQNGRNQFTVYHELLQDEVLTYVEIKSNLKNALINNEFELYYQPQFEISNHTHIGAEALIRWINPEKGIIPPDQFIGIAEKTGFILELGNWVIREVCRHILTWRASNLLFGKISINLSGHQILSDDFISHIKSILEEYPIAPQDIIFEITENVAIDDSETTIQKLNTLRAMGFEVALDDFGINYSSLSYLKKLPLDYLKLDKSFVYSLGHDEKTKAITESILHLAHQINLKVVAEGIEVLDQLEILKKFNCDYAQGYLFSRPIDFNQYTALYLKP